jgi:hypothetical protein
VTDHMQGLQGKHVEQHWWISYLIVYLQVHNIDKDKCTSSIFQTYDM